MREIKAPAPLPQLFEDSTVFLAGSIEMGAAEPWQAWLCEELSGTPGLIALNPRRDDWNANWEQHIANPQFREQVLWELIAMERADMIAMYFAPTTKSPITLMEFGLYCKSGRLIVCCQDSFWRKGNIDIVCARYNVTTVPNLEMLAATIIARKK